MSEKLIRLNQDLSGGYLEPTVHDTAHIIFPKNLPIKITVAGIKTIIHVGEFAIIPPGNVFAINSSPERYCIDFDFDIVNNNPEFNIIYPVISKPGIYHPVTAESGYHGYTVWYTNAVEGDTPPSSNYALPRPFEVPVSPVSLISEMCETLNSGGNHFDNTFAVARIYSLYSALGEEIIFRGFNGRQETVASAPSIKNLSNSIAYIHDNYALDINLDSVANIAGYSRTHYSKLFKEFYKLSFYDYLIDARVRNAGKLLKTTELSIAEIGESSGFSSSSTFNRVFKQETGYSPRDFRKL